MASSRSKASDEAERLQECLTKFGVKSVISLKPGRTSSVAPDPWFIPARAGLPTNWVGLMNHHTAGSTKGNTPSLGIVTNGRKDLPAPLCNGYGGRDLVYRILAPRAMANHPGEGGPYTFGKWRVPKDSARPYVWGTEWEHDGVSPWPAEMTLFMGLSNAAILNWASLPILDHVIEHRTWAPGRKIDRNGYTAAKAEDEVRRASMIHTLGARMALSKEDKEWLLENIGPNAVWNSDRIPAPPAGLLKDPTNKTWQGDSAVAELLQGMERLEKKLGTQP